MMASILLWVLAVITAALAYFLWEPFRFVVREIELRFPGLPKEFDGLRVLHLSDTHIHQMGALEKKWSGIIAKKPADICVWTGDIVRFVEVVPVVMDLLPSIKTERPIYAVLGNSEHKPHVEVEQLIQAFKSDEIELLVNSSAILKRDDACISIVGVDDPYSELDDFDLAFRGVDTAGFVMALAHSPNAASKALEMGADLVLSGHTHGGQLRIPGFGVLWTHTNANTKLNDGLYAATKECPEVTAKPGAMVFVHRGVGTSKLPIRFACRPEIVFFTLRCAPQES